MTTPLRGIEFSAGYLDVIGTPIVRGRGTSEEDTASSRKVAVINEAFARKFFQKEDPIGTHFGTEADNSRRYEVVGIAKDARYLTLDEPDGAFFFLPEAQADYSQTNLGSLFLHDIVILTRPRATLSGAQVRQAMASVDPSLPIISIRTLKEKVATQLTQQQLIARLTSLFGVLSLVLASIGLYTMSDAVRARLACAWPWALVGVRLFGLCYAAHSSSYRWADFRHTAVSCYEPSLEQPALRTQPVQPRDSLTSGDRYLQSSG